MPGAYDLINSLRIGFGTIPLDTVEGQQATLTIEVVGSNGLSAQDSQVVTLVGPDAGVMDAGSAVDAHDPSDAGVE